MKKLNKKIKQLRDVILFNIDINNDKNSNKECVNSFYNFLDKILYFFWFVFICFGIISFYLLITREIMQ